MATIKQFNPDESVLVLIDLQDRLMPAIEHGDKVLNQCIRIAKIANLLSVLIMGTEQSPLSIGSNALEIRQFCQTTITKEFFNACQNGLITSLPMNRKQIIVAGCETHVCVMQTALDLLRNQYDVAVLVDAVGSRRPLDKETALQRLSEAGATLLTVEMLAFEWLKFALHPRFKDCLTIIKAA